MSEPKVYVITGASRGIGFELTRQTLARGHRVVAGAREKNISLELKDLGAQEPKRLKVLDLDVQSDVSVAKFAGALGVDRIDVLINNAGIYLEDDKAVSEVPAARILETLNTNAVGPARVTQCLLPLLRRAANPRVANITSLMGSISDNASGGSVAYRMSKAALNMYTKTLAIDEKALITLTLHPGWVKTSMGGERAPLSPEASAEGLLKLIEDAGTGDSGKFFNYAGRELPW